MSRQVVQSSQAPAAVGAYSQGVRAANVVYFSGLLGIDPATATLPPDFPSQLHNILDSLDALLRAAGLGRADVVKTTVFLTDLSQFPLVNQAYERYFAAPYPARSCVEVSALPKNAAIEIEAIAVDSRQ